MVILVEILVIDVDISLLDGDLSVVKLLTSEDEDTRSGVDISGARLLSELAVFKSGVVRRCVETVPNEVDSDSPANKFCDVQNSELEVMIQKDLKTNHQARSSAKIWILKLDVIRKY